MNEADLHPLEHLLRLIRHAEPGAWFPREFAQQRGISLEYLSFLLEQLWLDELVEKSGQHPEYGAGLRLTRLGQRVLDEPNLLARLHQGKAILERDRGALVRQAVRQRIKPYVTWALLIANLLVFAYTVSLFQGKPASRKAFLGAMPSPHGNADMVMAVRQSGAIYPHALVEGEWWRLLTACFVQIGLMHLAMNMLVLSSAGRHAESLWGPGRYLIIYLLAGVGGAYASVVYEKVTMAGASGAICGILGAEAVWFFLNARYLPKHHVRSVRFNLMLTFVFLIAISFVPGVSKWGHLGGAVIGAVTALFLNYQRFGPDPWRWLALIPLVLVLAGTWHQLEKVRKNDPVWGQIEKEVEERKRQEEFVSFEKDYLPAISRTTKQTWSMFRDRVQGTLNKHPTRRTVDEVTGAIEAMEQQRPQITQLLNRLQGLPPFDDTTVETARTTAVESLQAQDRLLELSLQCLKKADDWAREEEAELQAQLGKAEEARQKWDDLLE